MKEQNIIIAIIGSAIIIALSISYAIINQPKQEPTNISEYLKTQDDKIATLSAQIEAYKENEAKNQKIRAEDAETFNLAKEYLTEDELDKMWDRWSVEICPKYEQDWYCKGDN